LCFNVDCGFSHYGPEKPQPCPHCANSRIVFQTNAVTGQEYATSKWTCPRALRITTAADEISLCADCLLDGLTRLLR
jgi:hypothetical protein